MSRGTLVTEMQSNEQRDCVVVLLLKKFHNLHELQVFFVRPM